MARTPQDDFKWFGEGFENFPKRLPEDVVEYIIFIVDSKLSDARIRERLQGFQRALSELEKKFLKEYIWQRDGINLALIREDGKWMLRGSTNYGDSVADEWLIVYFLRELSTQFPDAWIRIYDTDGEFLLIEAANALPRWVNPEVAENRVWLNSHKLLLIPTEPEAAPKPLTVEEALSIIRNSPQILSHSAKIDSEAFHRLAVYPGAISENQHHATIPLPRKLAAILHGNPSYVAPAVEAFYLRDPIMLRSIQPQLNSKRLFFPPEDWVTVSVRFTKVLYAQLRGQQWVPPEPWASALGITQSQSESRENEKAEIGLKLAAGFEMLVQDRRVADKQSVREIKLLLEDLENGEESLPTDDEIKSWIGRDDDELWLDIDFEDLDRELKGKGGLPGEMGSTQGFGDKGAQENLRKMVERFESFLTDEKAGPDGAELLEDMDFDDDQSDDKNDDEIEQDEAGDIEFDEEEFARLLRQTMGLPSDEKEKLTAEARDLARTQEDEDKEVQEIKNISEQLEAELNEHGALNLDPAPRRTRATAQAESAPSKVKEMVHPQPTPFDDLDEYGELDIDFNLAKNLLESFKGQVGTAGPAGNLMNLMGVKFPRDEENTHGAGKGGKP